MNSVKEEVIRLISSLPDDCTFEDIKYRLYVRDQVMKGLADIERGDTLSEQEVDREVSQWLKSFGPAQG